MIDSIWQYLATQATENQFFSGAALAGLVLAIANYARTGGISLMRAVIRRVTVSATVHSEDDLYVALSRWLKQHRFDAFAQQYRVRSLSTYVHHDEPYASSVGQISSAVLGPDYGRYLFRHAGKLIRVVVSKEGEAAGQGTSRNAQTREFLTITYLGLSRALLDSIIDQVVEAVNAERQTTLTCKQATMHGWRHAGCLDRSEPAICPVVLEGELLTEIEDDLTRFFTQKDWYAARGIPWRRGYLLHGPPGTGKTSLCRHLARRFGLGIYAVDSAGYMSGELGAMLKSVPPRSLILFEDIDCHDITNRAEKPAVTAGSNKSDALFQMNIGTLLNAIDGINPPEQMLIVMTSNNPQSLDPALVRPGRIDRRIFLGNCTQAHAAKLFSKFFPDLHKADVAEFQAAVPCGRYSPADLQEIFISANGLDDVLQAIDVHQPHLEVVRA